MPALANPLPDARDCQVGAAEADVNHPDAPAFGPGALDEQQVTAAREGRLNRKAPALLEQFVPAANSQAAGLKRCTFRGIARKPIGELIGSYYLLHIREEGTRICAFACAVRSG